MRAPMPRCFSRTHAIAGMALFLLLLPGCATPTASSQGTETSVSPPPQPPSTPWLLVENTTTLTIGPGLVSSGVYGVANENCLFLSSDGFNTRHIHVRFVNATLAWNATTPLANKLKLEIHSGSTSHGITSYSTDVEPSPISLEFYKPFGNDTVHSMAVGADVPFPTSGVYQKAQLTVRVEFSYTDQDEAPRFVLGTC
jgi:hypothetical protein